MLLAVGLAGAGASAQSGERAGPVLGPGLPIVDAPPASLRRAHRPPEPCPPGEAGAQFIVEYIGFPNDARGAFQAAVDTWACRIETPVPIRIDAQWEGLDEVTLGSAGPFLHRDFRGAPERGVWYPAALADLYAGRDLAEARADIAATFNADFDGWHLDVEAPPSQGEFDFYTVVLHEIGHGLGLIGGYTVEGGVGTLDDGEGADGPYVYDVFTVDGRGRSILRSGLYPSPSGELSAVLRDTVAFDGPAVRQVYGAAAPLYAPRAWVTGGSYSHLDEDAFRQGEPDGLMTPFIRPTETIAEPGDVTCAMLADLGWILSGDCAARVGPLPPVPGRLLVFREGPNPFRTSTRLRAVGSDVLRAELYDAIGRRVRTLDVRPTSEGAEIEVDGRGLAAGTYLVAITDGEASSVVSVVVVR